MEKTLITIKDRDQPKMTGPSDTAISNADFATMVSIALIAK
jgi:hypothetical protein